MTPGTPDSTLAAVSHAPGDTRIEEVPLPPPGPGEVLLRMSACGVCGSDLLDWYVAAKAPCVLGHEPVGVVVATGPDGNRLPAPGTRVFAHHHVPCSVCERCRRGHETLCETFRRTRLIPGGFSEHIVVPAENARADLLVLPDHVSDDAATLIEPLACCVRSQDRAGVDHDSRLLLLGVGQMGLLHVQAARARGCRTVAAADPLSARQRLAERYGAVGVAPERDAIVAALGGPPTVAIICTGAPAAFDLAVSTVAEGGVVQLFAPGSPGERVAFDPADVFFREVTVQSSYSAGPADTRAALRLLVSGVVVAEGIITHRFPLAETATALEVARSGEAIKVVVTGAGG